MIFFWFIQYMSLNALPCILHWQLSSCAAMHEQGVCVICVIMYKMQWLVIVFEVWHISALPPPSFWFMWPWSAVIDTYGDYVYTQTPMSHFEDDLTHIFASAVQTWHKQQIWVARGYTSHLTVCLLIHRTESAKLHCATAAGPPPRLDSCSHVNMP